MRRIALLVTLLAMLAGCAAPAADQTDADPKKSDDSRVVTVENNAELAALLSGPATGETVNAFSEKYRVQVVEFDGFVAEVYINPRESNGQSTIKVMAGDASDSTHTGPVFQLGWYGHALAEDLLAIPKGARQFDCHRIHRQKGRTRLFGRWRRDGRRDDDAALSVGRRCTAGGRAPAYTGDDDCERPAVVAHRPHREGCWHEPLIRRSSRGRRSGRCGGFVALGHVARYVGRPARGQGGNGKGREGSESHGHKTRRGACGFQVEANAG